MKKTEKVMFYETPEVEIVDCGSEGSYCQYYGSATDPEQGEW